MATSSRWCLACTEPLLLVVPSSTWLRWEENNYFSSFFGGKCDGNSCFLPVLAKSGETLRKISFPGVFFMLDIIQSYHHRHRTDWNINQSPFSSCHQDVLEGPCGSGSDPCREQKDREKVAKTLFPILYQWSRGWFWVSWSPHCGDAPLHLLV